MLLPQRERLLAALAAGLPSFKDDEMAVEILRETDSTNDAVRRLFKAQPGLKLAVSVARHQRVGRGRLGRVWQAGPDEALLCSLAWREQGPRTDWGLQAGIALAQLLRQRLCSQLGLKWPNDLGLVRPAGPCEASIDDARAGLGFVKLGGILIEHRAAPGASGLTVLGLGLNWCLSEASHKALSQALGRPVLDVSTLARCCSSDRQDQRAEGWAADLVCELLLALVGCWQSPLPSEALAEAWQGLDLLFGKALRIVDSSGQEWHGEGAGIDALGRLRLRGRDQTMGYFSAADVSLGAV